MFKRIYETAKSAFARLRAQKDVDRVQVADSKGEVGSGLNRSLIGRAPITWQIGSGRRTLYTLHKGIDWRRVRHAAGVLFISRPGLRANTRWGVKENEKLGRQWRAKQNKQMLYEVVAKRRRAARDAALNARKKINRREWRQASALAFELFGHMSLSARNDNYPGQRWGSAW